jgi:hypothetical protein
VYKVCRKNLKKRWAKSATLRNPLHDVNTAILGDPWVEDTNLDHVEPLSGVFPYLQCSLYRVLKEVSIGGCLETW